MGLECSATRAAAFPLKQGVAVHCRHALNPEIAAVEAGPPLASTVHRQQRLTRLLTDHPGPIGIDELKRFLSDHAGGPDRCLCRHDHEAQPGFDRLRRLSRTGSGPRSRHARLDRQA
ncbi:MAG: hypothetical protein WDA75_10110 [Candidatus Latescibacterota bacterium]|jgi:hypothetical protein